MAQVTVYKEQARKEWWTYKYNGNRRFLDQHEAILLLESGAKFVLVKTAPWLDQS